MASIKLYFDKRVNRKDGKFPLKINVTHKRQQALINLGVLLSPDQWDSTKGKVINGPNKSFLNGYISQRVHCAETELLNLRIAGKLDLMTGKQFKEHLQRILLRGKLEEKQEETGCSFVQYSSFEIPCFHLFYLSLHLHGRRHICPMAGSARIRHSLTPKIPYETYEPLCQIKYIETQRA